MIIPEIQKWDLKLLGKKKIKLHTSFQQFIRLCAVIISKYKKKGKKIKDQHLIQYDLFTRKLKQAELSKFI